MSETPSTSDAIHKNVSQRVNALMFRDGLTQAVLAELTGISTAGISQKMRAQIRWSLDDVFALATLFGVSLDYMVSALDLPPKPTKPGPSDEK